VIATGTRLALVHEILRFVVRWGEVLMASLRLRL
jgi:hypothetical protein